MKNFKKFRNSLIALTCIFMILSTSASANTLNITLMSGTQTVESTNYVQKMLNKLEQILALLNKKGSITVECIDNEGNILSSNTYNNLKFGSYTYDAPTVEGYKLEGESSKTVTISKLNKNQKIQFVYYKINNNEYVIELDRFNISNNNTNAEDTTKGINEALKYAKEQNYSRIVLPQGEYLIECDSIQERREFTATDGSGKIWATYLRGIIIPENVEFDITGCTLNLKPNVSPEQVVISFANSHNSKLIGGTIVGDRDTHLFDLVINKNGDELESGGFDDTTGEPIEDNTKMRTKNYICNIASGEPLPSQFVICPLSNTSMNTVDGGCRYIYCYDANNNYLGKADGNNSFLTRAGLPEGTVKIKVSFKNETRTDAEYYLTTEKIYITFECGNGIKIYGSDNVIIQGTTVKNFLTDGLGTMPVPIAHTNDNLQIIDCKFINNRRQGASFVGTTDGLLIKNSYFGETQGVDPQSGIDIEHYSYVKNVVMDGCTFKDNKKWDFVNYNGYDVEVKNCNFNGGIASTYGYNMEIHNNTFDATDAAIKHPALLLYANNKDDSTYYHVTNNKFSGYNSPGGGVGSSLMKNSTFQNNIVTNCTVKLGSNAFGNKYYDCPNIWLSKGLDYKDEYFENCVITGGNRECLEENGICENFEFINCVFDGSAIIKNSKVYSNKESFITKWGFPYIFENCDITTEYDTNVAFISSQGVDGAIFKNCNMNLSCTPFVGLNYSSLTIEDCDITFNDSYKGETPLKFYKNVYGKAEFKNIIIHKDFKNPQIELPAMENSTINGQELTAGIY